MNPFYILLPLALLAVLAVLAMGILSILKGGEFNRKYGNLLMRWRIGLQGLALALIVMSLVLGDW